MLLILDTYYVEGFAHTAGLVVDNILSGNVIKEYVRKTVCTEEYVSGEFYKRELPCILDMIKTVEKDFTLDTIVIDGYVYLNDELNSGLGYHLKSHISDSIEIIGIAKNRYNSAECIAEVCRGESKSPIFVSTTGDLSVAKVSVEQMHGDFRLPYLVKQVDSLTRQH